MTLLFVSFIAGVLTVLAPCILPLLPVVLGSSVGARSKVTPFIVIGSLALSILLFTYLLKASTAFIDIPPYVWGYISGGILIVFGLLMLFPRLWERLPWLSQTSAGANKLVGEGYQKKSVWGDVLIGAALGPIFSSCSPTYFVILATVLPASFFLGTVYLLAYIGGLVLVLTLIALLGQRLTNKLQFAADSRSWFKRGIGALFLIVGLFIMTGYDKNLRTWVLDRGYIDGVLDFELQLLEQVESPTEIDTSDTDSRAIAPVGEASIEVPPSLAQSFPNTDFSQANPKLEQAISGGPPKDGIPAIDDPTFVPLSDFGRPDSVQVIVLVGDTTTKVYPYNILTWHEIVNDTFEATPVAVTFCPLCGSAIVFNRTLPDGSVSTFGVSGSLLESNMIMYDRATENLWQQSTGKTLAGSFHPAQLTLESFQLLTLGAVRSTYPEAIVLSEDTGYPRDYARNPYAGYESDDSFVFSPTNLDASFPPKTIMAVFRDSETTFAAPWLELREAGIATITEAGTTYTLSISDSGELSITDSTGATHPFYFEMWFSVAVQHEDTFKIITP
jgi:cytochrome c biogenesis protein CcdA